MLAARESYYIRFSTNGCVNSMLVQYANDPVVIRRQMEVGIRSLEQLESYAGMQRHGSDWSVFLKGSCD